jgi:hypothetical protein
VTVRVKRKKLAWVALAIALMVVGCGTSATQSPPTSAPTPVPPTLTPEQTPLLPTQIPEPTPVPPTQTPAPTATTEALPFPVDGTFTKVEYTWEFKADGTYHTTSQYLDVDGVYTVAGDQIAVQEDYVPCKDIVGTYTWAYDGEALTFTEVDDKCTDRRNVVGRGRWLKKP